MDPIRAVDPPRTWPKTDLTLSAAPELDPEPDRYPAFVLLPEDEVAAALIERDLAAIADGDTDATERLIGRVWGAR